MIFLKCLQAYRGTRVFLLTALILALAFCCFCFPATALAAPVTVPTPYPTFTPLALPSYTLQQLPATPSTSLTPSQFQNAIDLAHTIYRDLFVFELIMIGITMGLFRDDLVGLFSATTMKVLSAGFFLQIMMVPNANDGQPLAYKVAANVINGFQQSGVAPVTSTKPIADQLYAAAGTLILSAGGREATDEVKVDGTAATTSSAAGNSFPAPFWIAHYQAGRDQTLNMYSDGLAMGIMVAGATIELQETILQYEVDVVLSVGIILLGFTACRWTAGFADNYHKYAISVGVKYIVFYLMLPVIQGMANGITTGSLLSFLPNSGALLGLATATINSLTASVLLAAIPGFAASLMSGQSGVSVMSAIQQSSAMLAASSAINRSRTVTESEKQHQRDATEKAARESPTTFIENRGYMVVENEAPVPSPLKGYASKKAKEQQKEY